MEVLVKQATWEADGVLSLSLVHPEASELPAWTPGAHLDLHLGDRVRQYSLCGDPADQGRYRVAVLRAPDSRGGSEYVHERLRPGQPLRIDGPRNHFTLEPSPRYLFVAGGIGITPLLPMLRQAAAEGRDWRLAYGGRSLRSMAFLDELAGYGERVEFVPQDERGPLDLDALLGAPLSDTLVYCCGPEPLLAAVEERCADWPPGSLRLERFAAKPQDFGPDEPFEVVCQRSDVTVRVGPGTSIVDALEDADIWVPSACREGICGTCETRVIDGEPDHRDSLLSEGGQEADKIMLPCVSRSLTPRLVLDL
ncbi:PDR/VanB family oxidoreductase [Actinomadura syzygii]|uniref:Oxidoreductase n=1 Tax=Actinomadura syzygii TaxID=1427538 RepID=A0A5D0U3L0_9ACTN|nr:PDR/VanB family oxidoreductase [Actinomadura syzygii]TYC13221.1 oxidoreductase [Actinomadura syzygii]